jgi:hypothetical protein
MPVERSLAQRLGVALTTETLQSLHQVVKESVTRESAYDIKYANHKAGIPPSPLPSPLMKTIALETPFEKPSIAHTANKGIPLEILGSGTIFLSHAVDGTDKVVNVRLAPMFYIKGLSVRLMSIGAWLQQGCILRGTKQKFAIEQPGRSQMISLYPTRDGETIYWFSGTLIKQQPQLNSLQTVFNADYELMHRRMGHLSRDILKQARRHTTSLRDCLTPQKIRSVQAVQKLKCTC